MDIGCRKLQKHATNKLLIKGVISMNLSNILTGCNGLDKEIEIKNKFFLISFIDKALPKQDRHLGCCIIEAGTMEMAIISSYKLERNPCTGSIQIFDITTLQDKIELKYMNRFIENKELTDLFEIFFKI